MMTNLLFSQFTAIGKRLAMVLTMLLIVGIGQVWATEVIFTTSESGGWTTTAGAQSGTIDGVTLAVTNGIINGTQLRCYANATMTISSDHSITNIEITCTASGTSNYGPGKFSGTGYTYSGTTGTWAGSSNSVSLKASAQVRMTKIVVTYTAGGGDTGDGEEGDESDCDQWVEVQLADIEQTDDIVITMTNGTTTWALTNGNGTSKAPAATTLTVNSDKSISNDIISDAIKWNISNNNGTLTIYPTGQTETWLYCTATNDGVRVGTNENKTFTIEISKQDDVDYKYLKHIGTSRYLGIYTGTPDWRCYTTATSNNAKQTLKFYKYVACGSTQPTHYLLRK